MFFFFTTPFLALFPIIILVSRQICGWLRSGLQRIFQVQLFLKNHLLHGPKAHLTSYIFQGPDAHLRDFSARS